MLIKSLKTFFVLHAASSIPFHVPLSVVYLYIYIYILHTHTYSHRFAHRMMINRVFLCRCTDPGVRLCCYGAVHSNVFSRAWENTCSLYSYTKTLAWKKHDEIPLRRPKISPGSSRDTARQRPTGASASESHLGRIMGELGISFVNLFFVPLCSLKGTALGLSRWTPWVKPAGSVV